jgi:hypothetical protein
MIESSLKRSVSQAPVQTNFEVSCTISADLFRGKVFTPHGGRLRTLVQRTRITTFHRQPRSLYIEPISLNFRILRIQINYDPHIMIPITVIVLAPHNLVAPVVPSKIKNHTKSGMRRPSNAKFI